MQINLNPIKQKVWNKIEKSVEKFEKEVRATKNTFINFTGTIFDAFQNDYATENVGIKQSLVMIKQHITNTIMSFGFKNPQNYQNNR